MKKILCLVLALMLAMFSVAALAESASPKGAKNGSEGTAVPDTKTETPAAETKTETPAAKNNAVYNPAVATPAGLALEIVDDTDASAALIDTFAKANEAGNVLAALPDDIVAALPEGLTVINEIVTAKLVGDTASVLSDYRFNAKLDTLYAEGTEIAVLIGKLSATPEWTIAKEGKVKADGSFDFVMPVQTIKSLGNDPFVLAVVSK